MRSRLSGGVWASSQSSMNRVRSIRPSSCVDDVDLDPAVHDRREIAVSCGWLDAGQLAVRQVAQPWAEPEAQHGAKNEHVVSGAASVGVGSPVAMEPKVRFRQEIGSRGDDRRTASDPQHS